MTCPECHANTYGLNKDFCTRCDWSCDHEFKQQEVHDEINGFIYFDKCYKCFKEKA